MFPSIHQRFDDRATEQARNHLDLPSDPLEPLFRDELEALYASRMESESWLQRWQLHRARESAIEQELRWRSS